MEYGEHTSRGYVIHNLCEVVSCAYQFWYARCEFGKHTFWYEIHTFVLTVQGRLEWAQTGHRLLQVQQGTINSRQPIKNKRPRAIYSRGRLEITCLGTFSHQVPQKHHHGNGVY